MDNNLRTAAYLILFPAKRNQFNELAKLQGHTRGQLGEKGEEEGSHLLNVYPDQDRSHFIKVKKDQNTIFVGPSWLLSLRL